MRRSDREITDMDRIMEIVRRQSVCCVAFQDTPCPYLIPMNYGAALENGRLTLYFHGAAVGTKLDRLNADPHVSFTIVGESQVSLNFEEACRSTAGFDSVCGTGTAELVPAEEKRKGLAVIMNHAAECEALAAGDGREDQKALPFSENSFSDQAVEAVTVWRIAAASITGKHHD